eukprot:TRINITY_DN121357_c0_g1_i1.p1 TRINITY_DN121357_c0_g1~~TRINITY_DN121357_c0_g1_i1.p1  ORF type:complete len:499 (+),score=67.99 TRINITY_DN121357_c0_g1_i1:126-1622(+)
MFARRQTWRCQRLATATWQQVASRQQVVPWQCRAMATPGKLQSIKKAGSNCTRETTYKENCNLVDLSSFNEVSVDVEAMTATAGATVNMEKLVKETLAHGFLPPVVPEFKRITVGGAIMGAAVESSSGKYGQFSDTCDAYELRLGDGDVVQCTAEGERVDLFDALPGSYGSLALLHTARMSLVPASKFVSVSYQWFDSLEACIARILEAVPNHEFVEGISYVDDGHVVIIGDFDHESGAATTQIGRSTDPWFYEHLLDCKQRGCSHEVLQTEEWLHRHDRGAFWMARPEGNDVWRTPGGFFFGLMSSKPIRPFLDDFWTTEGLFKLLHRLPQVVIAENFLVTDVYTHPKDTVELCKAVREGPFTMQTPLWLCPVKAPKRKQLLSPHGQYGGDDVVLIDVGLYGRIPNHAGIAAAKYFEQWGLAHNARKMHYSQNYYSETDFWSAGLFDKTEYDTLRRKYAAEGNLVDLYSKVGNCEASLQASYQQPDHWAWAQLARWT